MKTVSRSYEIVLDSPLGSLGIRLQDHAVARVDFLAHREPPRCPDDAFSRRVLADLDGWFGDPGHPVSLPVSLAGTPFQRRVWHALCGIAVGETLTYGELAAQLGSGARAVGNACRRNPVPVIVPCHRVVGVNGMGGYGGLTGDRSIWRKHWMLSHEGAHCAGLKSGLMPPDESDIIRLKGALHA